MSEVGSVSSRIDALKNGSRSAGTLLWHRYRDRLQFIADSVLGPSPREVADEEDVVIRAFAAFLRRTAQGAYPGMRTRDDLWRLLVAITRTYAWKQRRFFGRLRRRRQPQDADQVHAVLRSLASSAPPPDVLASIADTLSHLLGALDDDEMRTIAMGRLEGLSNEEIADKIQRSVRTVERRLNLIRSVWKSRLEDT